MHYCFFFFFFFLGETSTIVGCFCGFVVPGAPEGSTGRLIFVVVFGEARIVIPFHSFDKSYTGYTKCL